MALLTTQLEQLENAQLVRRAPDEELSYLFKHTLTQETAYESLLLKKRREIHHRVATAFEQVYSGQLDEYAAVLATHYAAAGDDAKTVTYAARAAELAQQHYALPEARHYFMQAIQSLSRLPESQQIRRCRIELIVQFGEIAWVAETPGRTVALFAEAEKLAHRLGDANETPEQALLLARIHYQLGGAHLAMGKVATALGSRTSTDLNPRSG